MTAGSGSGGSTRAANATYQSPARLKESILPTSPSQHPALLFSPDLRAHPALVPLAWG